MRNKIVITALCFISITSFAETKVFANRLSEPLEVQQASNWEYLGKVSAYYFALAWYNSEFDLYVKVISGKPFYQVRNGGKSYSVSIGSYNYKGKTFNASFKEGSNGWTYYFNI